MVELKARFDERTNIQWALSLEEAGVHVVYGIPGLKTHAKAILIVRREGDEGPPLRPHRHGQLQPEDGAALHGPGAVHDGSGHRRGRGGPVQLPDRVRPAPESFRKLLVAPINMREGLLEEIRRTVTAHSAERPSRIQMKMNALVDPVLIRALYDASRAGVKVELNIRGICCLRPGVPGVSENIRVVSAARPLPGALAHLPLRAGRRGALLHRLGGSDAAQPGPPRGGARRRWRIRQLLAQVRDLLERCLADNTARVGARWRTARGAAARPARREALGPGRADGARCAPGSGHQRQTAHIFLTSSARFRTASQEMEGPKARQASARTPARVVPKRVWNGYASVRERVRHPPRRHAGPWARGPAQGPALVTLRGDQPAHGHVPGQHGLRLRLHRRGPVHAAERFPFLADYL